MRSFLLACVLVAAVSAMALVNVNNDVILGGALCKPCMQLILNGETNTIGDFNGWYDKEVSKVCASTGVLHKECVNYFDQYENDFDGFIKNKADPKTSCESIDFCN